MHGHPPAGADASGLSSGSSSTATSGFCALRASSCRWCRQSPRVVTVSSSTALAGRVAFDNLQGERRYSPARAAMRNRSCSLLFMFELVAARGTPASSARRRTPARAPTNLQRTPFRPPAASCSRRQARRCYLRSSRQWIRRSGGGDFFGPKGMAGPVGPAGSSCTPKRARDVDLARSLPGDVGAAHWPFAKRSPRPRSTAGRAA